jgi:hypothetical protein
MYLQYIKWRKSVNSWNSRSRFSFLLERTCRFCCRFCRFPSAQVGRGCRPALNLLKLLPAPPPPPSPGWPKVSARPEPAETAWPPPLHSPGKVKAMTHCTDVRAGLLLNSRRAADNSSCWSPSCPLADCSITVRVAHVFCHLFRCQQERMLRYLRVKKTYLLYRRIPNE